MCQTSNKAIVLEHVHHEGLGTIGNLLKRKAVDTQYIRLWRGEKPPQTIAEDAVLIIMGGPMGVYETDIYPFIKDEIKLIEYAMRRCIPTLGVCLGAQLMAKAAGGDVYKNKTKEIGWHKINLTKEGLRDRLLVGLPDEFTVFQWHGDTFDLPIGATLLASSEACESQLIRINKCAYAFQFHLEVTEKMTDEWLNIEENKEELKKLKGLVDPDEIRKNTPRHISALNRYGEVIFSRFFEENYCV